MVRIVSHETHTCKTCAVWACHYTLSALDNEPSLTTTEGQRETVIHSNIVTEHTTLQHNHNVLQKVHATLQLNSNSLQQTNVSLLREIDIVCSDLASTRDDLSGACRQLDSADEIDRLTASERTQNSTINDLKEQVNLLKS